MNQPESRNRFKSLAQPGLFCFVAKQSARLRLAGKCCSCRLVALFGPDRLSWRCPL